MLWCLCFGVLAEAFVYSFNTLVPHTVKRAFLIIMKGIEYKRSTETINLIYYLKLKVKYKIIDSFTTDCNKTGR